MSGGKYLMYVGTFTHHFRMPNGDLMGAPADGIGIFEFDASSGDITHLGTAPDLLAPSWVTFHPTLPVLYTVERKLDENEPEPGAITSFRIDEETGALEQTSRVGTEGTSPPFVSVHPSGKHAYCVHFVSGHVVGFPLDEEGRVLPADTVIKHELLRPVPEDVEVHHHLHSPHSHKIVPAPNGRYVTVSDVGMNALVTYATDPENGKMASEPSYVLELPFNTGPRHHDRHPSGKYIFACGEANDSMNVISIDNEDGKLSFMEAYPTVNEDYVPGDDHVGTAECICHPNGKAVYVSNRGDDSIAVFTFDEETGKAEFKGTQTSFGVTPRAFSIDPTGKFMIVANQTPGSLVRYTINPETMWPEPDDYIVETPTPVCIQFRPRG